MPVTISSIKALSGSTRKENGTRMLPALIQSKRGIVNDFTSEAFNSKKTPRLMPKDIKIVRHPMNPTTPLDSMLRPKPAIKKPISGNKGINQTNFIILYSEL
jgi:hypothetical protein